MKRVTIARSDNYDLYIQDALRADSGMEVWLTGSVKLQKGRDDVRRERATVQESPIAAPFATQKFKWDLSIPDGGVAEIHFNIEVKRDKWAIQIAHPLVARLRGPFLCNRPPWDLPEAGSPPEPGMRTAAFIEGTTRPAFFLDWDYLVHNPSRPIPGAGRGKAAAAARRCQVTLGPSGNLLTITLTHGMMHVARTGDSDSWSSGNRVQVHNGFAFAKPDWYRNVGKWQAKVLEAPSISAASKSQANVSPQIQLATDRLPAGNYTLLVEPAEAIRKSTDPVGPLIADALPKTPNRIFRPVHLRVGIDADGWLVPGSVKLLPCNLSDGTQEFTHARIAEGGVPRSGQYAEIAQESIYTQAATEATDHLVIDVKPIWWKLPSDTPRSIKGTSTDRSRSMKNVELIVVHCTDFGNKLARLGPCHLTIHLRVAWPAIGPGYAIDVDGHIVKVVRDTIAAQHAGGALWAGRTKSNWASIGIEIEHKTKATAPVLAYYVPYGEADCCASGLPPGGQYEALAGLVERLVSDRRMSIPRSGLVGHNDVERTNKKDNDPGMEFDWELFEARNLGLLRGDPPPVNTIYGRYFADPAHVLTTTTVGQADVIREVQTDLRSIGYSPPLNGVYGKDTEQAVRKFQAHFFTEKHQRSGRVDGDTARKIKAVLAGVATPMDWAPADLPRIREEVARKIRLRRIRKDSVWCGLFPEEGDFVIPTQSEVRG